MAGEYPGSGGSCPIHPAQMAEKPRCMDTRFGDRTSPAPGSSRDRQYAGRCCQSRPGLRCPCCAQACAAALWAPYGIGSGEEKMRGRAKYLASVYRFRAANTPESTRPPRFERIHDGYAGNVLKVFLVFRDDNLDFLYPRDLLQRLQPLVCTGIPHVKRTKKE